MQEWYPCFREVSSVQKRERFHCKTSIFELCVFLLSVLQVPVPSKEWVDWVKGKCEERGWAGHSGDVMVWRELVKRGGRGMYVGGVKEFEEYASHYHNITPLTNSSTEDSIGRSNNTYV